MQAPSSQHLGRASQQDSECGIPSQVLDITSKLRFTKRIATFAFAKLMRRKQLLAAIDDNLRSSRISADRPQR